MRSLHVIAGLFGLVSGALALFALKGATLHRKSGMVFVYTMLFMSASGAVMAALKPQRLSVVAGALTFYLVATGLLTVRRPAASFEWMDVGAMLVGLATAIAGVAFGLQALNSGTGTLDGLPAASGFVFGAVALLATLGDLRMLRARGLQGAPRIARHLWRMCFALFIATASFFLGQPRLFPKPLRDSGVLAIPVLLVLLTMFYWLARVSFTGRRARACPRA
jgi:uncharacterized membrane protein